eukprot:364709-Chlamydomonas_euryale.AAC.6
MTRGNRGGKGRRRWARAHYRLLAVGAADQGGKRKRDALRCVRCEFCAGGVAFAQSPTDSD